MGRFRVIAVVAAALACLPPIEAASGATVQTIVDSVSTASYQSYQLAIEGMGPGVRNRDWIRLQGVGSPGNQAAQAYLENAFGAMDLNVTTQGTYLNVIGELPGTKTPENIYIIGAHFDHIAGDRPGGDDNASGTAGVLEAARVMSRHQFESTIRFIGFNAEEDGLLGSKDYVAEQVDANGENVVGMVNLDMILRPGWDSDANAVIDLDLGNSRNANSLAWAGAYQQAAEDYVPSLVVDETVFILADRSDHYHFDINGYAAFTAIENTAGELSAANLYYHKYDDASDRDANNPSLDPPGGLYNYSFASDVVRASVGLIAQEAVLVPEPSMLVIIVTISLFAFPILRRRKRGWG